MRSKLIILFTFLYFVGFSQVPNTTTFSLQDVVNVVNPTTDDLVDCIADAVESYYDPLYYTSPATSLLEFRNYSPVSAVLATVTTNAITDITQTSATGGGNVTSDGGSPVAARGVCWSTSVYPTTANSYDASGTGTGSFAAYLTGLSASTLYYVRAYAINGVGTAYGAMETFVTLSATFPCDTAVSYSGGNDYPSTTYVELGNDLGWVSVVYDAENIPDLFIGTFDGGVVFNTGYRGSAVYDLGGGSRSSFTDALNGRDDPTGGTYPDSVKYPDDGYPRVAFPGNGSTAFEKTTLNSVLTVHVYAPMSGTAWDFTIGCPL